MKKLVALAILSISAVFPARAQWVVYDPTMHVQQIIDTAQQIAKYVQMVNNQVQQIHTLTSQLNEFKHYEDLFGDPSKVLLPTVQPLVSDLKKTELGQTLTTLQDTVNAGQAMLYNANGLFRTIGETFTTPDGQTVNRPEAPYLPLAAVQKTTDNFLAVSADAAARRSSRSPPPRLNSRPPPPTPRSKSSTACSPASPPRSTTPIMNSTRPAPPPWSRTSPTATTGSDSFRRERSRSRPSSPRQSRNTARPSACWTRPLHSPRTKPAVQP